MSSATHRASCLALLAALVGCGAETTPPPTDASSTDTPTVDTPVTDTPATDTPATDSTCQVECAAPPPGCHYEGSATCNPPRCPPLVCASDAGSDVVDATSDASVDVPRDVTADVSPDVTTDVSPDVTADVSPDVPADAPRDVAVDATPDAAIVCGGSSATSFPTFDRSCRGDADCFVAQHQTDCCGNSRAMGLAVSQRDAFTAAERICSAMYPGCGCPARPPVADDGMIAVPPAMIVAACRSGLCTSFVP